MTQTWKNCNNISYLIECPYCSNTLNPVEVIKTLSNKKQIICTKCSCEIFENTTSIWFKVPNKQSIIDDKKLEKYLPQLN